MFGHHNPFEPEKKKENKEELHRFACPDNHVWLIYAHGTYGGQTRFFALRNIGVLSDFRELVYLKM